MIIINYYKNNIDIDSLIKILEVLVKNDKVLERKKEIKKIITSKIIRKSDFLTEKLIS